MYSKSNINITKCRRAVGKETWKWKPFPLLGRNYTAHSARTDSSIFPQHIGAAWRNTDCGTVVVNSGQHSQSYVKVYA